MKKLIAVFLSLQIILFCSFITYARERELHDSPQAILYGVLEIENEVSIDYSNITFDLFRLEQTKKDSKKTEYAHVFETRISPDSKGNIVFKRPSDYCYLKIDENSIPTGFGVSTKGILLSLSDNSFHIALEKVEEYQYDIFNEKSHFYNRNKTELIVNPNYKVELDDNLIDCFLEDKPIRIECAFNSFQIETEIKTDNIPKMDRIDYLYEKGLINEEKKINLYLNNLQGQSINDESDYMAAIAKISSCRTNTNISEELRNEINDLLMESVPTYDNEVIYSDSYFAIHYEANTLSMSTIYTVASYLNFAKATLCFTFEFETPSFEPNKDKYQVYLIPEGDFSGRAVPSIDVSGVSSYIEIVLPDDDALTNYKKGTIVHEFMHAVQFMYLSDNYYDSEWRAFNEATANSLKARLISNPNLKFYVDQFQNSPNYSLFTAYPPANQPDREYGAVLFPLYIEQTYSDFNTIRSVYETFSEDEDSVYETIDNTLQTYEISSLRDAYTEFAYYNYNIQYFYNYCESDWQTKPALSQCAVYPGFFSLAYKMGSHYFETNNSMYTRFGITFDCYVSDVALQKVELIDDEFNRTQYSLSGSPFTAIFTLNPGDTICMIVSNVSISNGQYYFTANYWE